MSDPSAAPPTENPAIGYTLWAVFRRDPHHPAPAGDLSAAVAEVEASGVTVRGFYDVSGLRADADLMIWLHSAPESSGEPEALQAALRVLRRAEPLASLIPVWNAMGVHRDAEFTASHLPAFLRGKEPETWLTVYPFVRSYEWYILPDDERRAMLADHGRKGSEHRQVLSNTVASFALGDYEWILALEAPELVDLVDLMRHLRQTEARRHVREEVPFYTGRRIGLDEIGEVLS
ncbi:hydrogen peroxide-dependent heme synthase [Microbacterium sp. CFBP9034]|uniref:hydrogen peroxide-dependent heme synthase n=1 Tax=Microbacterium sp. CFBP9034 TaxID=3096540 RepID=UPI002A69F0BD|nr:hydrogen peroxide-dependent heme synthase [Microbacterium sp. CFBP9034]MDY0910924.1 hydrogen peroxide-dependent heme synthase [Microbacterium sp. CFBP9034]